MIKFENRVVVEAREIEKAVKERFGEDIELAPLMWPEDYMNDCYKSLYFDDVLEEYHGFSWENEEKIRQRNYVYKILREYFPHEQRVLVDVSW